MEVPIEVTMGRINSEFVNMHKGGPRAVVNNYFGAWGREKSSSNIEGPTWTWLKGENAP